MQQNTPGALMRWFKKNWGFAIFLIDVITSLAMLLFQKNLTGHYINYTEPAKYLWRGEDPYGIGFPGSPGAFFYSPGCALYYYGLFTLFTPKLGQFLYMFSSVVIFVGGLENLLTALKQKLQFDIGSSPYRHLIWLMAGSEMVGGIVAVKIDVMIVGINLWAVAAMITRRLEWPALIALGLVTSWKLHPVSVFGLILVAAFAVNWKDALRSGVAFALGMLLGFVSPFFVLPQAFALSVTQHWRHSLAEFVASSWLETIFQHLYGFGYRALGIPMSLTVANYLTLVIAVGFALLVFVGTRRLARTQPEPARVLGLLYGLALGSAFVAMFSHLVQSNSYIIYFPLPLALCLFWERAGAPRRPAMALLILCYFFISIAYSDLVPRSVYHALYDWGVKPVGVLALVIPTVCTFIRLGR